MSRSDQNTPYLYRTFPRYGRSMEAGKPCAARVFHTFHTFRTCLTAACTYRCERAPARTRTRVYLSLLMYGRYGRYGRGPQDKDFEAPNLCHTSIRYGISPAAQDKRTMLGNAGTASADICCGQAWLRGEQIADALGVAGPSIGQLHTGQMICVSPLLFSPTKGVM